MSEKVTLLPDEDVVLSSEKGVLTLTTKRVLYDSTAFGSSNYISISLKSVSSCGLTTLSYPTFLILSVFTLLISFMLGDEQKMLGFLAAVLFVLLYLMTKKSIITIASNGGQSIIVPAKGMSKTKIIEFLVALDAQKLC